MAKEWWTVAELAARLHLAPKTVRKLVAPYREHCHKARNGPNPRLVLWIPHEVVVAIERAREAYIRPA